MSGRAWLLFVAMALIWGIPYLLIKVAVSEIHPATLVFSRTALGALLLLPVAAARRDLGRLRRHWAAVLVYTVVEIAGPWFLLSDAERRLSSSLSGLLIAGVPLAGAVLSWIITAEDRPNARGVAGLVIGFAGVALVVGLDVEADDLLAVGEIALVVLGYATGAGMIGRQLRGVPIIGVVAASLGLTAVAYLPVAYLQRPDAMPSSGVVLAVVVLGAVCTALGFILFFALIHDIGPVRATVIAYFNPAVAIAAGVLVLGERLTLGIAAGSVLIVVGSLIATNARVARPGAPRLAPS